MTFFFLIFTLTIIIIYILWVLFKPRKKIPQKKVSLKKNPALKNKIPTKKQKPPSSTVDQVEIKKSEQMKKDPEIISRVVRYWLNER